MVDALGARDFYVCRALPYGVSAVGRLEEAFRDPAYFCEFSGMRRDSGALGAGLVPRLDLSRVNAHLDARAHGGGPVVSSEPPYAAWN